MAVLRIDFGDAEREVSYTIVWILFSVGLYCMVQIAYPSYCIGPMGSDSSKLY